RRRASKRRLQLFDERRDVRRASVESASVFRRPRLFSPVADAPFRNLFTSSAATSGAELIQQRSETRR
ncbi:MAG: hypothetical protein IKY61_05610, partial [Thermoguttaceae bacterium]|nr:hypothetical protein [Thermoguttaceae bacterium]